MGVCLCRYYSDVFELGFVGLDLKGCFWGEGCVVFQFFFCVYMKLNG